jgi:WD40 repeat protein
MVWDVVSGRKLLTQSISNAQVDELVWSPDDRRIASGGQSRQVHIWDSETGQEVLELEQHQTPIRAIRWSPNGQKLAAVSEDGEIKIWNATNGYEMPTRAFWQDFVAHAQ